MTHLLRNRMAGLPLQDLSPADLQRIERAVLDASRRPRRKGEHPEVTIRFRERDVEISTATHHTHSRAGYVT